MTTLKQISSQSLTIGSGIYTPSNYAGNFIAVISPTTPIIVVQLTPGTSGDFVVLINGSNTTVIPPGSSCYANDDCSNLLTSRALNLTPFGLTYWITGGGCIQANTVNCNANQGGIGLYVIAVNPTNGQLIFVSPSGQQAGNVDGIEFDTQTLNVIIKTGGTPAYEPAGGGSFNYSYIIIIPLSSFSTFLNNTYPSNTKWLYVAFSDLAIMFTMPMLLANGTIYLIAVNTSNHNVEYASISESTVLNNGSSGEPTTPSSYQSLTPTVVRGSWGNGGKVVAQLIYYNVSQVSYGLEVLYTNSNNSLTLIVFDPTSNTAVGNIIFGQTNSSNIYNTTAINIMHHIAVATYTPSQGNGTIKIYIASPFSNYTESLTTSGYFAYPDPSGYLVVFSDAFQQGVTVTVYQVIFDTTPVFQNLNATKSGNTITATGTLIDLATGNPIANATVYLVGVNSFDDNGIESYTVIASGTTNSNGQFTISGTPQSSFNYYGVVYVQLAYIKSPITD